MKKRMFLSTILMTLVLLLAVTTATFAWYSADNANASKGAYENISSITTQENTYSLGSIKVNVKLELTGQNDPLLSKQDGYSYINVGGEVKPDTSVAKNHESLTRGVKATVTFTIQPQGEDAERAATEEELKGIAGDYVVLITAGGQAKIADSHEEAIAAVKGTSTVTFTVKVSDQGAVTGNTHEFFVGMEGDDSIADGKEAGSIVVTSVKVGSTTLS